MPVPRNKKKSKPIDSSCVAQRFESVLRLLNEHGEGQTLAIMNQAGLTLPQLVSLQELRSRGPHTISALARRISLSLAATSHLVDRLVQGRLVHRREDPLDRRQRFVEITPTGKRLVERLTTTKREFLGRAIAKAPSGVRERLGSALLEVILTFEKPGDSVG